MRRERNAVVYQVTYLLFAVYEATQATINIPSFKKPEVSWLLSQKPVLVLAQVIPVMSSISLPEDPLQYYNIYHCYLNFKYIFLDVTANTRFSQCTSTMFLVAAVYL
jgi:hypothetical protein